MVSVQRAIGALVGSAVGDALGAPFEFERPGLYRSTYPEPVLTGPGEMRGGGGVWWVAQWALVKRRRHRQLRKARLIGPAAAACVTIRVAALARNNNEVGRWGATTTSASNPGANTSSTSAWARPAM